MSENNKSTSSLTKPLNNESNSSLPEIEDIYCLPQKPQKVTIEDIQKASAAIRDSIAPTPCTVS